MRHSGHLPAFPGAGLAGIGAALAMICFVLAAFTAAILADIGAQAAQFARIAFGMFIGHGHELRGHAADVSTIPIELDTAGHHLHIIFVQAGGGAVITFLCALVARFDTTLEFLMHVIWC